MSKSMYENISTELFHLINEVRTNPSGILHLLQERLTSFQGDGKCFISAGRKYRTVEGARAVEECFQFLTQFECSRELVRDETLDQIAREQGEFLAEMGVFAHNGVNGSTLMERVEQKQEWEGTLGEIITGNYYTANDFLLHWLISDGSEIRGDRLQLLNNSYCKIGIHTCAHSSNGSISLLLFSTAPIPPPIPLPLPALPLLPASPLGSRISLYKCWEGVSVSSFASVSTMSLEGQKNNKIINY